MKKIVFLFVLAIYGTFQIAAQTTITVMDSIIFHDGYAALITTPAPPVGVLKLRNDLFTRKLTASELQSVGTTLQLNVVLKALCDNYDRIGNINLALVPIGAATYHPDSVKHIEIARFITPFMNKNIQPDSVTYTFDIKNVAMLLKESSIVANYDIWIELAVFGVPYAANTQVAGCAGRNDVFMGKLLLVTNTATSIQSNNVLMPLFFNTIFNNYQAGATDTIGKTTKSITFNVPNNLTDAAFFLITSNHGANSGGEEYVRRIHDVYFDNNLVHSYKPGRLSCEPFRQFNTQSNGIYGSSTKSDAQWQSFSNWCPGDVIDIRQINLGAVSAGSHTFNIQVPTAVFNAGQGNFPLSLYLHGKTSGVLSVFNAVAKIDQLFSIFPNPSNGDFTVEVNANNAEIMVTDLLGKVILKSKITQLKTNLHLIENGIYIVYVSSNEGSAIKKLIVNQ